MTGAVVSAVRVTDSVVVLSTAPAAIVSVVAPPVMLPFSTLTGSTSSNGAPAGALALNWPSPADTRDTLSGRGFTVLLLRLSLVTLDSPANTPSDRLDSRLLCRLKAVSDVSVSNTPSGRLVRSFSLRYNSVSDVSVSNTPSGRLVRPFSLRYNSVSDVNSSNTPPDRLVSWLLPRAKLVSDVSLSNTPPGRLVSWLSLRVKVVSPDSPSNTPSGRLDSRLSFRYKTVSDVSASNTPSGRLANSLVCRSREVSDVSSSNTPAGRLAKRLVCRFKEVSDVSPSKSPAFRLETRSSRFRVPPIPARLAAVTAAQSLTPASLARIALRTAVVRPQMPGVGVTVASASAPLPAAFTARTWNVCSTSLVSPIAVTPISLPASVSASGPSGTTFQSSGYSPSPTLYRYSYPVTAAASGGASQLSTACSLPGAASTFAGAVGAVLGAAVLLLTDWSAKVAVSLSVASTSLLLVPVVGLV